MNIQDKIDKTEHCWNWTGEINDKGYGRHYFQGKNWSAHRFVYEQLVGSIPRGLQLDHLCFNRRCVNPKHLEPVTSSENIRRAHRKKISENPHCKYGHSYPENLWLRVYKGKEIRECRECRRQSLRRFRARQAMASPFQKVNKVVGL